MSESDQINRQVKDYIENKGSDINAVDFYSNSPVYYACLCGHLHVLTYLLKRGAYCNSNSNFSFSTIFIQLISTP